MVNAWIQTVKEVQATVPKGTLLKNILEKAKVIYEKKNKIKKKKSKSRRKSRKRTQKKNKKKRKKKKQTKRNK